jgi:hypothetical protein
MGVVVTVMTVLAPSIVPLRVAFTKIPTVPEVVPAVKVTVAPLPLSEPNVPLVSAQAYVIVSGQVTLHVGVAVKTVPVLAPTEGAVGLTVTEVRVIGVVVIVIIAAELCSVIPLSVAFTKRSTTPAVLFAVKVTEAPVVVLSWPTVLFVRVHE